MPERLDFRYELRFPDAVVLFNIQNADHAEVRYARRLRRGEVELAVLRAALEHFVALGREHDFLPMVAYAPSAYTAYADFVAFEDEALARLMPWFSATQRTWLQAEELLYYPANVHYTPAGHRLVGETQAAAIENLRDQPDVDG